MLELYHSGLSTCSKQVRLALVEKGLSYVSHYVELHAHAQLATDYLKLNPWGVVPTLIHDGHVIVNSAAINEYLDDVFPEPPLRPADPVARARMRLWTYVADITHPAMANATYNDLLKAQMADLSAADVERMIARIPAPERRERVRRMHEGGFDTCEMALAFERMEFVLSRAEDDLANGPWFAGETYSLADISMLAIAHRINELRPTLLEPERVPRVSDWWQRMLARPAVQKILEYGTDETPKRPARQTVDGMV